ncbi:hypothetical protein FQA39_LY14252 [Lamprigera yunnana]|nr:hypothetical protein FQA39_LY14252 [Lamprigera yunnana]
MDVKVELSQDVAPTKMPSAPFMIDSERGEDLYPPPQPSVIVNQPVAVPNIQVNPMPMQITMQMPPQSPYPPGLEYLSMIDQLLVNQTVEMLEVFSGLEMANKYKIKNSVGQMVYYAKEESGCCSRNCCGALRKLEVRIVDNTSRHVIHLRRPFACQACCFPCCLQKMEVCAPPGVTIGYVEQNWNPIFPSFSIKNASDDVVLTIKGPCCTSSCCFSDVKFRVLSANGSTKVGKIYKQWSGALKETFTDADNFVITFPLDLDARMKAVLLGACFLIDMMYFESSDRKNTLKLQTQDGAPVISHQYRLSRISYPTRRESFSTQEFRVTARKAKKIGYSTNLIGKWHMGHATKNVTPTLRGFDYHFGYWNGFVGYFDHSSSVKVAQENFAGFDMYEKFKPAWDARNEYATRLFTRKAKEVIAGHNPEQPLFLMLSHLAPHSGNVTVVLEVPDEKRNKQKFHYIRDEKRQKFAGMMDELDKSVGQLMCALSQKGILDDAIILFVSDNGAQTVGNLHRNDGSNWPLRGTKFTIFEGGVRNVAVMYYSKLREKSRIYDGLIHISDLYPTLIKVAGGDTDFNIDGINQWDTLINNAPNTRKEILLNIDEVENFSGIIGEGGFKLLNGSATLNFGLGGFYGDDGRNISNPKYDIERVLHSITNKALGRSLTKGKILKLRESATIGNCRRNYNGHTCNKGEMCLFDIVNDPCEATNVMHKYPEIVRNLEKRLSYFWDQLVPQKNRPVDPMSNPKFHNRTWTTCSFGSASPVICWVPLTAMKALWLGSFGVSQFTVECLPVHLTQRASLQQNVLGTFYIVGWNDVSFHGSNQIPTPNIDALAYNGIILNRFYTEPTCTPSRAALMTGLKPKSFVGFQGFVIRAGEERYLPFNVKLLPEQLQNLGYSTQLVGKWHLGYPYKNTTPTYRGFDYHYGYWNGFIGYFDHFAGPSVNKQSMCGFDMHEGLKPHWENQNQYATHLFTKKAEEIIARHDKKKPLFLMLSHLAPHAGKSGVVYEVPDEEANKKKFHYIQNEKRRKYSGMVDELDNSVGAIITALSQKGILNDTIILFISDNGAQTFGPLHENSGSNWPLRGMKFSVLEGGVRNVGILYYSRLKKKSTIYDGLIHITDLYPTLIRAAGGDLTEFDTDGINQWDALINNAPNTREEILVNIDEVEEFSAIIGQGSFKLINGSAPYDFDFQGFYGDDGRGSLNPVYNVTRILNSVTNKVLDGSLTKEKVLELRQSVDIGDCQKNYDGSICGKHNMCLFDVFKDPCETANVIDKYPEIAKSLKKRLQHYWDTLMSQKNQPVDPKSNPSLHNNTWVTWLDL